MADLQANIALDLALRLAAAARAPPSGYRAQAAKLAAALALRDAEVARMEGADCFVDTVAEVGPALALRLLVAWAGPLFATAACAGTREPRLCGGCAGTVPAPSHAARNRCAPLNAPINRNAHVRPPRRRRRPSHGAAVCPRTRCAR